MKPIIQIAGIKDQSEAQILMDLGVDYLGFPLRLDVHKPDLSEQEASRIIRALPDAFHGVVITYLTKAKEVLEFLEFIGTSFVQIHGAMNLEELKTLRSASKKLFIIKSLVIRPDTSIVELLSVLRECESCVDAFITDTFDPTTGASGATGLTHDWKMSKEVVRHSQKPVILAGGLKPSNVRQAILEVRPAGVDAHTGVEDSQGNKDPKLVEAFVRLSKEAFSEK